MGRPMEAAEILRAKPFVLRTSTLIMNYSLQDAMDFAEKANFEQHEGQPLKKSPKYYAIIEFANKVKEGMQGCIGGILKAEACLDLLIGDMPDGLPVPKILNLPNIVPYWNEVDYDYIERIFEFANSTLHDNGIVLLFLLDNPEVLVVVNDDAQTYGFKPLGGWWSIHELPLSSYSNPD